MAGFTLVEVKDKQSEKEFLKVQVSLYRNDPNWIQPLSDDIKAVFDPKRNKMFNHGRLARWIVCDQQGKTVGRVAAFVDDDTAELNDQPTGGMGFFDCINNQEAAFMLFDQAKAWLQSQGMQAMDGSINFGSRERWWGVLVDGYTPPSYGMNYNYPYYKELFETYGFKNYFNQYSYLRPVNMDNVSPSFKDKAERVAKNPDYRFEQLSLKRLEEAGRNFRQIYNKSWVNHSGIKEMTEEAANALIKQLKPIIDERLVFFAFHLDEPIGFFIQIPELNQVIKHLNGKFSWYHKLKLLYLLKVKKVCNRIMGLIFAIVPEHRGRGIEGALCMAFAEVAFRKDFPYKDIDLTWVGDFNPLMMRFQEQIGGKIHRTHVTYRLLFDAEKQANEFKRCPRMGKERNA